MMQQDFITIGILGKPHGTSGAFHFKLTSVLLEDTDLPDVLHIKLSEGILPYFVSDWSLKNSYQGTISFEDIESREDGAALVNAELMIKSSDFADFFEAEEENYLLGFNVVDVHIGAIGKIVEVTDNTIQDVAVVQYGEYQVMFPLVDNFIVDENKVAKTLTVKLPEGLIEAYTENAQDERDED
jgi:16S rRNA processing protein RimM